MCWYIIVNRKQIEILHSHGAVNMGALCTVFAHILGKKNVTKIASAGRIPTLAEQIFGKIVLSVFKKSSAIISMTDEIDTELMDIGTPVEIVHRITNGVCQVRRLLMT